MVTPWLALESRDVERAIYLQRWIGGSIIKLAISVVFVALSWCLIWKIRNHSFLKDNQITAFQKTIKLGYLPIIIK